jgi:multiple sugar transport system substrate-binding protein
MSITRRESLVLASASIAASFIPGLGARAAVTDVPVADMKALDYKLEKGAELRVLPPAKFIDPDEVCWRENTKKYTEATGIPIRVDFVSWEDLRPQTAVVARACSHLNICQREDLNQSRVAAMAIPAA